VVEKIILVVIVNNCSQTLSYLLILNRYRDVLTKSWRNQKWNGLSDMESFETDRFWANVFFKRFNYWQYRF